jgi:DNA mismatch endonuclease (patch repair protein)
LKRRGDRVRSRMPDFLSVKERSERMSRIRGKNNKTTELAFRALCRASGLTGWRRHVALPGKPDFVFRAARLAIFIDGCFWHGCPKHCKRPSRNPAFWNLKIDTNRHRDARVTRILRKSGWRVVRIWEHDLAPRNHKRLTSRIRKLLLASPTPKRQTPLDEGASLRSR